MNKFLVENGKKEYLIIFLLFLFLSLLIYYPLLGSSPLWDDWVFIFKSWTLKNVNSIKFWMWGEYRRSWPLFYTVISLLKSAYGENVSLYRLTNVVLHSLNTFLIFYILNKKKYSYPLILALLYLVHPLNFFTVFWIVQIKTLLAITFFLMSFIHFFILENNSKNYFLAFFYFSLSLMTKSICIPVIFLFPFYENKKKLIPFVLIAIYSLMLTVWTSHVEVNLRTENKKVIPNNQPASLVVQQDLKLITPVQKARPISKKAEQYVSPLLGLNISLKNFAKYSAFIIYPWETLLVQPRTKINDTLSEVFFVTIFIGIFSWLCFFLYHLANKRAFLGVTFYFLTVFPLTGLFNIPIFYFSNFVEYWLSLPVIGVIYSLSQVNQNTKGRIVISLFVLFLGLRSFYIAHINYSSEQIILNSVDKSQDNTLIKLILAKHYFFEKNYKKSNLILNNAKKDKRLDQATIDREMEINYRGIRGEKIEDSSL